MNKKAIPTLELKNNQEIKEKEFVL